MNRFLIALLLLLGTLRALAVDQITATVTVTNGTVNADTIIVNGVTRTWTNNVVTSSTQILTNNTIGGAATNLWRQIAANPYSGPVYSRMTGTNLVELRGAPGVAMAVTFGGTWATVAYSTQTFGASWDLRLPLTVEDATHRTNMATLAISNIFNLGLSTATALESSTALSNYVALVRTNNVGNKRLTNSTFEVGYITNSEVRELRMYGKWGTNAGIIMHDVVGDVKAFALAPAGNGYPSIYNVAATDELTIAANYTPNPENILNAAIADNRYGIKALNNTWTGTNVFNRVTNSTIVGSALSLNTYAGTIVALTNGLLSGTGLTNIAGTNVTLYGTNAVAGALDLRRANNTSLANGNNAGVDFGTVTFVNLKAGPSAAFSINGIAGGRDGRFLIIANQTGQAMTIANESGVEPTAENRIRTGLGSDVSTSGNNALILTYDSDSSRWVVTSYPRPIGAGSGNVTGPGSSTDNAIARFDGAGGVTLQNSAVTIDDSANIAGAAGVSAASATLSGLTATRLLSSDGSKVLTSVANLSSWIAGTANRVTISDDGDGTATLTGPQDIAAFSTPEFNGLYINESTGFINITNHNNGALVLSLWSANSTVKQHSQYKTTTTDATVTTLATIPIAASRTYLLEGYITARRTGGVAGTADDGATYVIRAMVTTKAGTVTVNTTGLTQDAAEDQAAWACVFAVSGTDVLVRVTGAADNNVSWYGEVVNRFGN